MKDQFLKLAGVKSEKEFYKLFPDEATFMEKYGKEVNKILRKGGIVKAEVGTFTGGKQFAYTPVNYGDIYDKVDYAVTGSNRQMRMQDANLAAQQTIAQNSKKKNGLFDMLGQLAPGLDMLSDSSGGSSDGAVDGAMSESVDMADINMRYGGRIYRADNGFVQKMTNFSNTVGQKIGKGYDQADSSLGKVGGVSGAIGIGGDLLEGYNMIKAEQAQRDIAQQSFDLSNLTRKASQLTPDITERNYVRPEQQMFNNDQFNKQMGVGTNVLSARNGMRLSPGEIQNMYNPGDIYSDLGYESLDDSRKYKNGGKIKKAQFGFDKMAGEAGNALGSLIGGGKGKLTGAGKIGSTIGSTVGKFIPLPGAPEVLSGVGGLIGGIVGGNDAAKTASNLAGAERNLASQTFETGVRSVLGQNSAFAENGGNFQPQLASELEGIPLTRLFAPDPYMDTLRTGGNIRQNNVVMDGKLKVDGRGDIDFMAYNPEAAKRGASGYIGTSRGPSHDNGGFNVAYGDEVFEMEGNETVLEKKNGASIDDKSLNVLGNLKIGMFAPSVMEGVNESVAKKVLKGRNPKDLKYKHLGNDIARLTKSLNNEQNRYQRLLESSDDNDLLKMGSVKAGYTGLQMMYKDLDKLTDNMVNTQQAVNKTAEEFGIKDPESLYMPGKKLAKMGAKITTAQKGITKEQQSEGERLYKSGDIKGFQEYVRNIAPEIVNQILEERGVPRAGSFVDNLMGPRTRDAYQRIMAPEMLNTTSQTSTQPSGKSIADIQSQIGSDMNALEPMYTEEYTGTYPERPIADRNKNWMMNAFNQIRPYLIPSNAESLDPSQISGELMALADNDLRPVRVQTVQSQLASPYKVSFQDMINEITAGERAATRLAGYNPAAQSIIAAAAAREKSGIRGRELAENLRLENEIYNRNRDVLNADRMKNLELYDQQFVRQEQALANTKAVKQAAVNFINAKILQNRLANRLAGIAENMYNYRFDKQGRAINVNPLMAFNTEMDIPVYDNEGNVVEYKRQTKEKYDKSGLPAGKEITTQTRQKPTTAKNGTLVKAVK